jgi:hypothetical protein
MNTKKKPTLQDDEDFSGRLEIDAEARVAELDQDILKDAEEIAGLRLRTLSAGDVALLSGAGVGLLRGQTTNIPFDVGAILFSQSSPREEVRALAGDPAAFRDAVFAFLDAYEPAVFMEATPRVLELVDRMIKARSSVIGEASSGKTGSKKAGGRAG